MRQELELANKEGLQGTKRKKPVKSSQKKSIPNSKNQNPPISGVEMRKERISQAMKIEDGISQSDIDNVDLKDLFQDACFCCLIL
jgi:hypothetical protein